MRPGPAGTFGDAGETISAGVSSSLKMRSLDAIADCRMLYFSLRSWMGRKKRCAYCMNATSTPRVTSLRITWSAAEPDDARDRRRRQHFDHRVVHGVGHDRVFERVHVGAVDLLEALVRLLLAIEQLQHDDAGHVLLQVGVDPGDGDANAPVAVAHFAAEDRGRVEDERQHGEGDQRQPPAHVQHDDQNAEQHEDVFEDRDHAGGEHLVQRVHVAGDAGDQPPDRIPVEEGDVQALQMAEDLRCADRTSPSARSTA